jgi:hypothetical protein
VETTLGAIPRDAFVDGAVGTSDKVRLEHRFEDEETIQIEEILLRIC